MAGAIVINRELNNSLIMKPAGAQAGDDQYLYCKPASSLSINSYTNTCLSPCHSHNNGDDMLDANPNPKPYFQTSSNPNPKYINFQITSPIHNPNPNNSESELLEEGQGECNGDHHVSGSSSLVDKSEDTNFVSWRKPSSSSLAASCFCKDIEEEQEYFQQILGSAADGWTDEKHRSYLDSMEAEFLKSVMFKANVHAESSDLDDSASSHQAKASQEFKVYQNGRWRRMCVQAQCVVKLGSIKQLAVAVRNPWIKRFRSSSKKLAYFPPLIMEDPPL